MKEGSQRLFLELINDIVYMVSLKEEEDPARARVSYVNHRVKDITGYDPEEFLKDSSLWVSLVHPDDVGGALKTSLELLKEKTSKVREYRVKTKDGNYVWVEDRIIPVIEKGKVIGFIGVARDVTKRKVIEELSLLALEKDLQGLLFRTVEAVGEALRADLVVIYEVPEGNDEGVLRAGYGVDQKLIGKYRLPLREGTEFYYTFQSAKPVVVEDVDKEKRFTFTPDTHILGLKSGICSPLRGHERVYGTLCVYLKKKRIFSDEELRFIDSISNLLGLAFERKRFENNLEKTERRLQKLNRLYMTLSIVSEIVLRERNREELFRKICTTVMLHGGFRGVWIGIVDDELKIVSTCGDVEDLLNSVKKSVLSKITEGVGPCGKAYTTGEIFINNDTEVEIEPAELKEAMLRKGFLSSVAVPLWQGGKVVGIMNLYAGDRNFFDEEVAELVKKIVDQLSFALDFIEKEEELNRFSLAIEQTSDWVLITDENGIVQYANPAVEEITGYKRTEIIGKRPNLFKSGKHSERFYKTLWETILSGKTFRSVFINRRKDGRLFYIDQTITPIKDVEGNIVGFVATGKDITQERELEERLNYFAYYDPVTELPNRSNFMERLAFYAARTKMSGKGFAVLIVDVNRFKYINDTYGYHVGDNILKEIGRRIRESLRPGDVVARMGSDEFGITLIDLARKEDIPRVISKVLSSMEEPFSINGEELRITVSIGVAVFPDDGEDPEELVRKAELALAHAKERFTSSYQFFTEEMNTRITEFMLLEKHLAGALEKGEYVLYYQPCYNLESMEVHAAEALIRWKSEDLGLVPPSRFINVLEQTGLIVEVGDWVLREVCRKIKELNLPISVNVSPVQFKREDFSERVIEIVEESGIDGGMLILEITESTIMEDVEFTKRSLEILKEKGIGVAIDDFGTGYSSLAYLKLLPVDALKIDTSFIVDIDRDPSDKAIVNAIIQLAKSLDLRTTAEGIENETHLQILKEMGCDFGQGYYPSRPLEESELKGLLGYN